MEGRREVLGDDDKIRRARIEGEVGSRDEKRRVGQKGEGKR
jgi:hypothetical protein